MYNALHSHDALLADDVFRQVVRLASDVMAKNRARVSVLSTNHTITASSSDFLQKCNHRGKECIYVQSRRGGARVPRSKRQEFEKLDYVKIAQECESVPTWYIDD